mgnify:CR=1 FL=1
MNIKFSMFLLFISVNCFAHHPGNKIDAEKPYPLINLEIIKDKVDGYNLYIDLYYRMLLVDDLLILINE